MLLPRAHNITGRRFGRLIAETPDGKIYGRHQAWICLCDCGGTIRVSKVQLTRGSVKSCGCYRHENMHLIGERSKTHGMCNSREYRAWSHAKSRCYLKNNPRYPNYGGRGIIVCERWKNSFAEFLKDMGPCPIGYTLERMFVNENYEPGNCYWATREAQANNKTTTVRLQNGETLAQFSTRTGIKYTTVYWRYHHGLAFEHLAD
jgi:hypothetical protein